MHRLLIALLLLSPLAAPAQESSGGPLFMKDMLQGREFFETWGVGADYFTMKQDYKIQSLQFDLPGVTKQLSALTFTRWTMEALGASVDMDRLNAGQPVSCEAVRLHRR